MSSFWPANNNAQEAPPSEAEQLASKLFNGLKQRRIIQHARLVQWSREFTTLLKGKEAGQLHRVLAWFLQNIGGEFVPVAKSAKTFCRKFRQIEDAMRRDPGAVEISQEARLLHSRLDGLPWPEGLKVQLLPVIQSSLDNYRTFLLRWLALPKYLREKEQILGETKSRGLLALHSDISSHCHLGTPSSFVEGYLSQAARSLSLKEWSGGAGPIIFRHDCQRFTHLGRLWSLDFCGYAERWDLLMKELIHAL